MHKEAYEFIGRFATTDTIRVIEIGSKNYNGTARDHFPAAIWTGLDIVDGPCVDIVTNALDYTPIQLCNLVVCCEVFEHTPDWKNIIEHAARWLAPCGRMLVTCAGIGRAPHSSDGAIQLKPFEWYRNVSQTALADAMHFAGLLHVEVGGNETSHDTYGTALKH